MKIGWTNLLPRETKAEAGLDFIPVWKGFEKYFERITKFVRRPRFRFIIRKSLPGRFTSPTSSS